MIDPKLNELADQKKNKSNERVSLAGEQPAVQHTGPRPGLSVNDTIAGDANLSVGGRGVDTSGVRAGAGAGAGSTHMTPTSGGVSPSPRVVPGPTGSGTTPLGSASQEPRPATPSDSGVRAESGLTLEEIAQHAYRCWHERGCPEGSPEEDWHRAERELQEQRYKAKASSTGA